MNLNYQSLSNADAITKVLGHNSMNFFCDERIKNKDTLRILNGAIVILFLAN